MTIFKLYKINLIKNFYKTVDLLFIFNSINRNSNNILFFKKKLKTYSLKILKMNNKVLRTSLKKSITFLLANNLITNSTFFLKNINYFRGLLNKHLIFKNIFLNLNLVGIKFNNKTYSLTKLKKLTCFNYYQAKKILLQFLFVKLKKQQYFFIRNNVI